MVTLAASSAAAADGPAWRVTRGEVRAVCSITIGGRFEAKTTALSGTVTLSTRQPAVFAGRLAVDLRTLDTGISLRNHHLHDEYLEVDRGDGFAEAVLSNIHLGDVDAESFRGHTTFKGSLALHGTERDVAGQAEVRRTGPGVRVEASFPVRLPDFGISSPQYLGVGVRDEVQVTVSLLAEPVAPASARAQ